MGALLTSTREKREGSPLLLAEWRGGLCYLSVALAPASRSLDFVRGEIAWPSRGKEYQGQLMTKKTTVFKRGKRQCTFCQLHSLHNQAVL